VSHPIWASEDDGFVASKKSQYEEAMHRCEEERYDYNMNIEANLNVIALLAPIAHRIETMSQEERASFKLRPGLGGQSITIYERIIKKVYDKERGTEIIELLYSNPSQVVPILLKRLKQKDEEWKRAQVKKKLY
jgi:paired amphipathic helix protein Sin3a